MFSNFTLRVIWLRLPKKLCGICILLAIIVIIKRLLLDSIPAFFLGADILGLIFENVTFGLFASLSFYLSLNFRDQCKREIEFAKVTKRNVACIKNSMDYLILSLQKDRTLPNDQSTLRFSLSKHNLLDGCNCFEWNDGKGRATWLEFLCYQVSRIEKEVEIILKSCQLWGCPYKELILITNKLSSSDFVSSLRWMSSAHLMNKDMSGLSPAMWSYKQSIDELVSLYEELYGPL